MVIKSVLKRDGSTIVDYDRGFITKAIEKACLSIYPNADDSIKSQCHSLADQYSLIVEKLIKERSDADEAIDSLPIEEIQNTVEEVLIRHCANHQIAKNYIVYRHEREVMREDIASMVDAEKVMNGYLKQDDWRVNENASVNYSVGGLILHNSGTISSNFWLNEVYTKAIRDAHVNADIHLHDLCMLASYCSGWSLHKLIEEGFGGVEGKISSKPANHLSTLVNQMINFLGVLQNEWAGAQAFSSVDTYLAPFVRHDNLSYKEVKQNIQSLIFGLNISSRWGGQAVFSNMTFDLVAPKDLAQQPVIIGGKMQETTYGEYQEEMDMINKAFMEIYIEGDADGRAFAYPIPTYNLTNDFDWDSENATLLFKMAGKYGVPYFQNFINSDLNPSDVRSMCCRLRLDKRELLSRGGGLFGASEYTGSIGVCTINLPRLGYLTHNELLDKYRLSDTSHNPTPEEFRSELKKIFYRRLTELMDIARDSLEIKRKTIDKLTKSGLFPYTKRYLNGDWSHHFSTIGILGMNECCLNMNMDDISHRDSIEFAKEVLTFMRDRIATYQEATGNLYNLESTPGESTSYRFAKSDKKQFPDIVTSGESDPYYTNSTHLPVDFDGDDVFEALDLQDDLQTMYTGGTVHHVHIGESIDDPDTVKKLVKGIAYNYKLPYFTLSPVFSVCKNHGYLKGEVEKCPKCGETTEVYARIVGYYRKISSWNKGKVSEFKERNEITVEQLDNTINTIEQKEKKVA